MKRILFVFSVLNVGGMEKSLLSLLKRMDRRNIQIDLMLLSEKGSWMNALPSWIETIVLGWTEHDRWVNNDPPQQTFIKLLKYSFLAAMRYAWAVAWRKLTNRRDLMHEMVLANKKFPTTEYDLVVCYGGLNSLLDYIALNKVRGRRKATWIHFDVKKFGVDSNSIRRMYGGYDSIFIVSEQGKTNFDNSFPQFRTKTKVFHNIIDQTEIEKLAGEESPFEDGFDGFRIVTVGRLSTEKGQLEAIEALSFLRDLNLRWYFVGGGNILEKMKILAVQMGVDDRIVFLGTQMNPYPYMKYGDIYVQPSRHEGYCITLAEARCFDNPIVSTNFTGASEQLLSHPGAVVTGMTSREMADGMRNVIPYIVREKRARKINYKSDSGELALLLDMLDGL